MRPLLLIVIIFCFLFSIKIKSQNSSNIDKENYPTPNSENLLFYIQRTIDINTVMYEMNYNKDGKVNNSMPVKIYWIEYAEQAQKKALSRLQRKFAYGISSKIIDSEKKWFSIHLKAYTKADIFIMNLQTDKNYKAYTSINGKLSVLTKIFISIDGGTFWNPNVTSIELFGKNIDGNEPVFEKISP